MPVDFAKDKQQQALALCLEARGECLDLGKKISVPQDVMMEELNLRSNRGSRMFQERQKRAEKFTLEGSGKQADHQNGTPGDQETKELMYMSATGCSTKVNPPQKNNLITTLHQSVAKKGNPGVLAPGYSGPLKEIPPEKFNLTVIPKSYCSPWEEQSDSESLLAAISSQLPKPPQKLVPANYRCFNRAPMPFGGTTGSTRTLPLPGFELMQAFTEPNLTWERICARPNFNRIPRGWRV
ncbi:Myozenin-2 [Bagarius yarrelli]|uniref:Myozenin-2 n=1 Tax=Bagarius yarrelli TaxID=175774 RepID=A0A556TXE8_BAGYA|nr:Myozenin-2 [Bagarius yarrelli]